MEEKVDLCIVYDEFTQKQAKALYHKLSEKLIRCVCHDEKTYRDQEKKNTNFNKVLFFSETLILENLPYEIATTEKLTNGVYLRSNGCAYGIVVDPNLSLFLDVLLSLFFIKEWTTKNTKSKLYFDAVKYLTKDDNITIILPKQLDF